MMTKNAITVIDQELIDDAKSTISMSSDACDRANISQGTLKELISMCEDLIEINAELTKREQKYRVCIKSLLNSDTRKSKERAIVKAGKLLKGDSDE